MINLTLDKKKPTLVLTGGGTAGHVWPNFALANDPSSPITTAVIQKKLQIIYFGSKHGMERSLVADNAPNWIYKAIPTGKLRRYFSWQNFIDPFLVLAGFIKAFFFLVGLKDAVLFSKGGFVSAPVVWAAFCCRVPIIIHESDLSTALATKLTIPFATKIFVSFDETKKLIPAKYQSKVEVTGIPLRSALFLKDKEASLGGFGLDASKKTILIFGGSLGAEYLNKKIGEAVSVLQNKYNIIHLVGKGKQFAVESGSNYKQYEFLTSGMGDAYAASDLAICRAGASSIFELAAARIPMILVPLGIHQSRGDQIENARSFEKKGWAQILWEKDLCKETICTMIDATMLAIEEKKDGLNSSPAADGAQKAALIILSFFRKL